MKTTTVRVHLTYDVTIEGPETADGAVEGLNIPNPEFGIVEGYPSGWKVTGSDLMNYDAEVWEG